MSGTGVPQSRDQLRAAASEVREYALSAIKEIDHADLSRAAGLVPDDDTRHMLTFAERAYNRHKEDGDPPFWETEWASRRLERAATDMAQEALRSGNLTQLEYLTGMPEYESDVSGLHATSQLINWLCHSENCKLIYMAALMGRGKTDLAVTFLQVIHWHYKRMAESLSLVSDTVSGNDVPQPEFAANFKVEPAAEGAEVLEIKDMDTLEEWADEGSSDDVRWFIFDEASTELTAQSGANAQDVAEVMAPFVKKMRKKGINMIVIGHDKGDIHKAIRSMADFVDKTGLKTCSIYSGIQNREPTGHLVDLDGIPQTGWDFDTDDMAEWSWGSALEDDGETLDSGMSDREFKQRLAIRAADLYEWSDDLSMKEAVERLSHEDVSISTTMLQNAMNGDYDDVIA